ncbi:MAG: response regulator [Burkholderiaceae bacterium]
MRELLIVDDNAEHREVLRATLAPLGFLVRQADSFEQGLSAIERARPDLVLLDINLGPHSGWTLLHLLRERDARRPAVVMVSANAQENLESGPARRGYQGFVGKPVRSTELLDAVREALGLRWIHRPDALPEEPERESLLELLQLAAGGHARALEARLSELECQAEGTAAWVAGIRALRGDPDTLQRYLAEALREHDAH